MQKTKIGHLGITNEVKIIQHNGKEITLHRIKALMDFRDIKNGQLGGFVQHIENIQDLAWIGDEAMLFGNAIISGVSQLKGSSQAFNNAIISGDSEISGNSRIYDKATINGDFWIDGNIEIYGEVNIRGLGIIMGDVKIYEQFTSIGRLIISGYDEPIEITGEGNLGNGIYINESFELLNRKTVNSVFKAVNNTIFTQVLINKPQLT